MEFEFSSEQEMIRETIKKFVAKECEREKVRKLDEENKFPEALYKAITEIGFCGLMIPEEHGGFGVNTLSAVMVVEEIATVYPALAGVYIGAAFCGGRNIARLGTEEQKKKYLPALAEGSILFTYALRGPGAGYITPQGQTTAKQDGSGFIVNGSATGVRLADRADYLLTLVGTEKGGVRGTSLLIIDRKNPGIQIQEVKRVGYKGVSLCDVQFKDVLVPKDDLVGGLDQLNRADEQLKTLQLAMQLEVAASANGIARGAYEYAAQYAQERVQFGAPIVRFGAVKQMLVNMAIATERARWLSYKAAWDADRNGNALLGATMAAVSAVESARQASLDCMQVLGGYGYAMEYDAQRYLRDTMVLLDGGVSLEVVKNQMGDLLGLA